ncbi:hypothetical protein ALP13_200118 [Pseudomonas syringae pv. maculicola]|uniref:Uncharacterized protein n=1 Tax=Pseudomonas syringae pv. maculicola TaxID=59511 RepID=A0A3M6CCG6_PSEYM|nr:hypothetical protein ALP13_200118 [Pseudomonas syringae pv. maculicola]
MEVARQFFTGKCLWIASVAFPLRGRQEADGHALQYIGAKSGRGDDPRTADAATLQQPGPSITGYEVVSLASHCHREQKGVIRILSFNALRQRQ